MSIWCCISTSNKKETLESYFNDLQNISTKYTILNILDDETINICEQLNQYFHVVRSISSSKNIVKQKQAKCLNKIENCIREIINDCNAEFTKTHSKVVSIPFEINNYNESKVKFKKINHILYIIPKIDDFDIEDIKKSLIKNINDSLKQFEEQIVYHEIENLQLKFNNLVLNFPKVNNQISSRDCDSILKILKHSEIYDKENLVKQVQQLKEDLNILHNLNNFQIEIEKIESSISFEHCSNSNHYLSLNEIVKQVQKINIKNESLIELKKICLKSIQRAKDILQQKQNEASINKLEWNLQNLVNYTNDEQKLSNDFHKKLINLRDECTNIDTKKAISTLIEENEKDSVNLKLLGLANAEKDKIGQTVQNEISSQEQFKLNVKLTSLITSIGGISTNNPVVEEKKSQCSQEITKLIIILNDNQKKLMDNLFSELFNYINNIDDLLVSDLNKIAWFEKTNLLNSIRPFNEKNAKMLSYYKNNILKIVVEILYKKLNEVLENINKSEDIKSISLHKISISSITSILQNIQIGNQSEIEKCHILIHVINENIQKIEENYTRNKLIQGDVTVFKQRDGNNEVKYKLDEIESKINKMKSESCNFELICLNDIYLNHLKAVNSIKTTDEKLNQKLLKIKQEIESNVHFFTKLQECKNEIDKIEKYITQNNIESLRFFEDNIVSFIIRVDEIMVRPDNQNIFSAKINLIKEAHKIWDYLKNKNVLCITRQELSELKIALITHKNVREINELHENVQIIIFKLKDVKNERLVDEKKQLLQNAQTLLGEIKSILEQ